MVVVVFDEDDDTPVGAVAIFVAGADFQKFMTVGWYVQQLRTSKVFFLFF
jgi:hypothetical protein